MVKDLLPLVENVAIQAGAYLKEGAERCRQVNFEDATDVKLQADEDSEALIRSELEEAGFPMIGEEGGGDVGLLDSNEYFWVIDPLDGTYNYLREQKESCVSIGLMKGGEFELGVIYDFNADELISGEVGQGVWLNGVQVLPKWTKTLGEGSIFTGFRPGTTLEDSMVERLVKTIAPFKKVRMIGSAALALANVGLGRADAYFEGCIQLWDCAAGAAIVRAAGGEVKYKRKQDFGCDIWAYGRKEWAEIAIFM